MAININYDSATGEIVSYQEGLDDTQNACPVGCETITIDPSLQKFDPFKMKVVGGQLVNK